MRALFIHGIEDQGSSWEQTTAALARSFDCVTPDFPWRMFTDFAWLKDRAPDEVVLAELERVRPELCVAHSFGAIAPFYLSETERLDWRLLDRTREEFTSLMRDSIVSRAYRAGRSISEETVQSMVGKLMSGISPLAFTELFGHFALMRRRRLEDLSVPGCLIGSEDDPGFAGDRARELSSRLGLDLTLLPGRDHFLHYTAPETVADIIQSLFALFVKDTRA